MSTRKRYPVGAGTRWSVEFERLPKSYVALHQQGQRVVIAPADLCRIASAVAYWAPAVKQP
jgi:hypothetical protein